jgi:DNA-binding FadR family transcriptional regulator
MARQRSSDASGKTVRPARKRARGSGAVAVYDELRRDILELRMEPGTLLDETELAARFKLSRSPVREALIRLSAEGLVQTLRNRSSIVAPFDIVAIPSYLDALELFYRLTTRLAAKNRSAAQLAEIIGQVDAGTSQFSQVTAGMQAQSQGGAQIAAAMQQFTAGVREAVTAAQETCRCATSLQESISGLKSSVTAFRVREGG